MQEFAYSSENPHRMKPSSVGKETADELREKSSTRTSENAWDVQSPMYRVMMNRSFGLLRMAHDWNTFDGIQVVRYRPGEAYIVHSDTFPVVADPSHNWDPSTGGTNRYVTIFMYMNDVAEDEGGQTVFPYARDTVQPSDDAMHSAEKTTSIRSSALTKGKDLFGDSGRWEYKLTEQCYSSYSLRPRAMSAAMFYHQHPLTGSILPEAQHGACPVLGGEKWGANMWIWNGPRYWSR